MKGSFRSVWVRGGLSAVLLVLVLAGSGSALDTSKAQPKEKETLPAVLDKNAPVSTEELKAIQDHVKKVLKKAVPATVGIRIGRSAGSGVIISADGYVLTAGHVSAAPNRDCTLILPDGKEVKGKTLGWNRAIDSGLIKISEKGKWDFVEMGDSSKLKTGQWCLSVGHPGGFKSGRSPVVRLGRILLASKTLVQTDCTLVGGDSGGPLFDMQGKVIGIHSRIGPLITANIHVPVNTYRDTWDRLVKGDSWSSLRSPNQPYIGIGFERDSDNLAVSDVYPKTPADVAGIKVGDVVAAIDGKKLARRSELAAYLDDKKIGDEITLEILRDKKPVSIKLKLGKRTDD